VYSNITSFFHFVNKRASYSFGIISLAHAPVNVTDFSIGSINCYPNNVQINWLRLSSLWYGNIVWTDVRRVSSSERGNT
jgi:hypothetical protein